MVKTRARYASLYLLVFVSVPAALEDSRPFHKLLHDSSVTGLPYNI